MPSDSVPSSRGGRPRDPDIDVRILESTRKHLVEHGYSRMTLADIVADTGITRPTLYRRWANKLDLTVAALDYGFAKQRAGTTPFEIESLGDYEAFEEAVERVDPRYFNPHAIILQANFMTERNRVPELTEVVRKHAVDPRLELLEETIRVLKARGAVRKDVDEHIISTLCFGAFFAAYLRGEDDHRRLAKDVAVTLWDAISVSRPGRA